MYMMSNSAINTIVDPIQTHHFVIGHLNVATKQYYCDNNMVNPIEYPSFSYTKQYYCDNTGIVNPIKY